MTTPPWRWRARLGPWAVLCAVAAVVVAGCAHAGGQAVRAEAEVSPPASDFERVARAALAGAQSAGLAPAQVEAVEVALRSGSVSFEDYSAATQSTLQCFEDAGVRYEVSAPQMVDGVKTIEYHFEAPMAGNPVADACILRHSDVVHTLYVLQPTSIAARDAAFEAKRPAVVECLNSHGYTVDDDATRDELTARVIDVLEDASAMGDGAARPAAVDCAGLL